VKESGLLTRGETRIDVKAEQKAAANSGAGAGITFYFRTDTYKRTALCAIFLTKGSEA